MTKKHDANQKLGVIRDAPDVKADYYSQAENIVQYTSNHVGNVLSRQQRLWYWICKSLTTDTKKCYEPSKRQKEEAPSKFFNFTFIYWWYLITR